VGIIKQKGESQQGGFFSKKLDHLPEQARNQRTLNKVGVNSDEMISFPEYVIKERLLKNKLIRK